MSEWISVEDRLPNVNDTARTCGFWCVLTWEKQGEHQIPGYSNMGDLHDYIKSEATHWMPLPEPPEA